MTARPTLPTTPAQALRLAAARIRQDGGRLWTRETFYRIPDDNPSEVVACAVGTINLVTGSVTADLYQEAVMIRKNMYDARVHAIASEAIRAAGSLVSRARNCSLDPRFQLMYFNDQTAHSAEEVAALFDRAADTLDPPPVPATNGDIGPVRRRLDLEPMPETIPVKEPAPAAPAAPSREPEPAR